jgi:hypothetical protein
MRRESDYLHSAFFACSLRPGAVVPVDSRSAAQRAAPQVLVKAKKMPAIGTYTNLWLAMKLLLVFHLVTYHLKKDGRDAEAGVSGLLAFNVPLLLRTAHALELEVA